MFARFRQTSSRLQVSSVEGRRVGGKVLHEHIASLGSVPIPAAAADRIAFWGVAGDRLERLANRIGNEKEKIVSAIHARIPLFDGEDIRTVQRENAEADEKFWAGLQDLNASTAAEKREFAKAVTQEAEAGEAQAKNAAEKTAAAKDRIARLAKGEDVKGGLGKPFTQQDAVRILKDAGWTAADIRRSKQVHMISELGDFEAFSKESFAARTRAENATVRKVLERVAFRLTCIRR